MPDAIPTIDTEGISDVEKATAKFQFVYQGMLAQLRQPGFVSVLCAHEAAHLFYFALLGATEYDPHPARIRYDQKIGDYVGDLAGVQLLKPPTIWQKGKFQEWLGLLARAHAAGGVVARKLSPSEDGGDADDKERFKRLCDDLNQDPNASIIFEEVWEWAQVAVAEDLKKPEMSGFIEQQAAILRREFGLEDVR
jgi:hypothetical protein